MPNKSFIQSFLTLAFLLVQINSFSQWTETNFLTGGKIVSIESSNNTTYAIASGSIYSSKTNESLWNKASPRFFNTDELEGLEYIPFECENNLLLLYDFRFTLPLFYRKIPDSLEWDTLYPQFQGEVLDIEHFNDSLFTLVFNQNELLVYSSSDSGNLWNLVQNIGASKPSSAKPMEVLGDQLFVEGSGNILNVFNVDSNRFESLIINGLPTERQFIDIAVIDTTPIILLKSEGKNHLYKLVADTIWLKGDDGIDTLGNVQAISALENFASVYSTKNDFVQIYTTKNVNSNWKLRSNLSSDKIHYSTFRARTNDSLFFGNNLNLFISTDTGLSFSVFNDNMLATNCASGIQHSEKIYISCQFDGLYESFTNLNTVNYAEPTLSAVDNSSIYLNDSKLYYFVKGINSDKLLTSSNNGSQWYNKAFPSAGEPTFFGFDSSSLYIKVAINASSNALYRTDDDGDNWINLAANYNTYFNKASSFSGSEKNIIFCTGNTDNLNWRIIQSTNKGQSWQESLSGLPLTIPSRLYLLSTNNITMLYGTWVGEDQLYIRINNSWSFLTNSNLPPLDELFYEGQFDAKLYWFEGIHYLSYSNGIFTSIDNGLSWVRYSNGIPLNPVIKGIFETNSKLVAITKGVGNYEIDKLVGISPQPIQTISPIFPSVSTGIFNIKNWNVLNKIEVYTITGQQVITITKSSNQFNLSEFNSGIYVARVLDKSGKLHIQLITLQK